MDPVLELRTAMVTRMLGFAGLTALVSTKVYDQPPQTNSSGGRVSYPYVSLGPASYDGADADCIVGGQVMIQIDAWSDGLGQAQVAQIAHQVRRAFRDFELTLTDSALATFDYWRTDYLIDGAVKHASIRFTAIVEEP